MITDVWYLEKADKRVAFKASVAIRRVMAVVPSVMEQQHKRGSG